MKVLFGINNDNTVKGIVDFYEQKYKEKLEYKNVYYFKQFIHEISNGNYDRAVLLEDLEKYPTNNYAQIDEYLFKNIDAMTDNYDSKNIIFVSSDRRKLGDEFLSKLFNLGIYTTLTGQDRTKGKVCAAINQPFLKKDIKKYYDKVIGENVYNTAEVSEIEIQRIISYYKNQNGVPDKYNEIFDRIAMQYTNEQLKVIINFLPQDVKQYLSFNNKKYKELTVNYVTDSQIGNIAQFQETSSSKNTKSENQTQNSNNNILHISKQKSEKKVELNQNNDIQKNIAEEKSSKKSEPKVEIQNTKNDTNSNFEKKISNETKKDIVKSEEVKAEIKSQPQIIEKIVEKPVPTPPKIVTQVVEKEVVRQVYEVPKDYKKTVCFVGAPKTGTTFCINAIGTYLARNKVKTAIVDVTRKRDTYTIYTYDNEGKRAIAAESLKYASNGINEPLIYEKLSIYTGMPGDDRKQYKAGVAIDTIIQNNNVILIDADFTTPYDYFRLCQEIYLVQDMDILNIPQATIFLRELKSHGVPMDKIRIIINKHVKTVLTARDIIDGIATYSTYDLKRIDTLFNSSTIPYYILPFDIENYKKYIEMLYKYSNKFSTFTSEFTENLNMIINSIYPIGGIAKGESNSKNYIKKKRGFFK